MNSSKMFLSVAAAAFLVVLSAGSARAVDNPASCTNDIDCVATPACGGDLCDWDQGLHCKPAGGLNKGWCMTDTDCKCKAAGAHCTAEFHCTITQAASAGAAGTGGGAAGTGSATGAAGTGSGTGAAGTGGGGGGGGGCSIAASSAGGLGALLGLAIFAGGLARRRRR